MLLRYKVQPVNAVYENHRCLFQEHYETINTICGQQADFPFSVKQLVKLSVVDEMFAFLRDKVRYTLVQALRLCTDRTAHMESRGITLPFL